MMRLLLVLALAGCALVPPDAARSLEGLDPTALDPADIAVAVAATPPFGPPVAATLTLRGQRGEEAVAVEALLLATPAEVALPGAEESRAAVYAISESDLDRVRAVQAQIAAWKAEDPDGTIGSLSVAARPCTIPEEGPGTVGTFIRLGAAAPFEVLTRPVPAMAGLQAAGVELADLRPC